MNKLLEDYKAYYRARSQRYDGHPHFKRLALAEKNLADEMERCTDLNAPNPKIKQLAERSAIAQSMDMAAYRYEVYTALKETIRAKGNQELMDYFASHPDGEALEIGRANVEISVKNVNEIGEDITILDHFMDLVRSLEVIEWYEYGEAIPEYETKMRKQAAQLKIKYSEEKQWFLHEARKYYPDYDFRWQLLWEERHRRLIPFPDQVIAARTAELASK